MGDCPRDRASELLDEWKIRVAKHNLKLKIYAKNRSACAISIHSWNQNSFQHIDDFGVTHTRKFVFNFLQCFHRTDDLESHCEIANFCQLARLNDIAYSSN